MYRTILLSHKKVYEQMECAKPLEWKYVKLQLLRDIDLDTSIMFSIFLSVFHYNRTSWAYLWLMTDLFL